MGERNTDLSNVQKLCALILCLGGFGWICYGQFDNYIQGTRSWSQSTRTVQEFQLPNFIFCPDKIYKKAPVDVYLPREGFDEVVNEKVRL